MSKRRRQQRRKHFDCGHIGWGRFCHRCALATELEIMSSANLKRFRSAAPPWMQRLAESPDRVPAAAMLQEAARLRRAS